MWSKEIVSTNQAPKAIGPYSQAVISGNLLVTSRQLPIDPKTGQMVDGGIEEPAKQVLKNLAAIARAAGTIFQHTIKCTIF